MKSPRNSKVEFKGIERNTIDIDSQDGSCSEIINMRYKDGAWRPVGTKDLAGLNLPSLNNDDILYYHAVTDDNIIRMTYAVGGSQLQIHLIRQDGGSYTATLIYTIYTADETYQNITSLNNVLIVTTDKNRYFFLWDFDTEAYTQLEDVPMPLLNFVEYSTFDEPNDGSDVTNGPEYDNRDDYEKPVTDDAESIYTALVNNKTANGMFRGKYFFRIAYKLFDGSFIKHSQLYYFQAGVDSEFGFYVSFLFNDYHRAYRWFDVSFCDELRMYYLFSTAQRNILEQYKGVIQSIYVFMTPAKDFCNFNGSNFTDWDFEDLSGSPYPNYQWDYRKYTAPSFTDLEIIEQQNYYKIHEITLTDILDNPSGYKELVNKSDILTEETLPVDDFTHHNVWGQSNYIYNSRLHFGNMITKFFSGFNIFKWQYGDSALSTNYFVTKTYIKTDQGEKIVYNYIGQVILYNDTSALVNNIVIYPDQRAYKMEVLTEDPGSPGDYYSDDPKIELELKPHPYLNFSYYVSESGISYTLSLGSMTRETLDTDVENKYLSDVNRVQLSQIDNALFYPSANSYQIGNDDESVIGFGTIIEALSEGQYGQFPIYVFTSAGIFVLEQGTGEIIYQSVASVSREICNRAASITDIGGGVLFATEKGLMVISGREVYEISTLLAGVPKEYLVDDATYQQYIDDENYVTLIDNLSTVDFLVYLTNAKFGYDTTNKELIVSNISYNYSYVYSFLFRTWFKITDVYNHFITKRPYILGTRNIEAQTYVYDMAQETADYLHCLMQTRPLKLGSLNRKSIERLIVRAYFDIKDLTYAGAYLYGSVDGKNYVHLRSKTPQDASQYQDILIKRTHANFKYLILVIAGQQKESGIRYFETEFFERWNKKLR